MEAGGTVTQCVRQERTQHRGAGRQISSAWCLGEVEERNEVRFLFAMEILPGNPAFVKFEGHARPAGNEQGTTTDCREKVPTGLSASCRSGKLILKEPAAQLHHDWGSGLYVFVATGRRWLSGRRRRAY